VATDDRDLPAGAAEGGRDDMPVGPPAPPAGNGKPGTGGGRGSGTGDASGPDNDANLGAPAGKKPAPAGKQTRAGTGGKQARAGTGGKPARAGGKPAEAAEEQAGGHGDDDFEPYLPPGPNPFSSVHPQGAPPYRPAAAGHDAADEPGPVPGPLPNGAGSKGQPPDAAGPGYAGFGEPGPAPGHPGIEAGHAGSAERGYPPVSPYPAYRSYGPHDEAAGDAVADYGLPSPQAYGLAPPPPPAEPLPDLGPPERVYRNEPYGPPGYRDDTLDDGESPAPPAERARPSSGRRIPGATGQRRAGAAENGLRGGPAPADAPPARGPRPPAMPPGRAVPGQGYPAPGSAPSGPLPPGGAQRGTGVHPKPRGPHGPHGPDVDDEDFSLLAADAETVQEHETADSLTAEALLHGKRPAPASGWRRTVFRATGGLVRVGESASSQRRRELIWRARTPVAGGHHRVAVMSLKGGVGKTTTTVGLGATLATLRGDRVIAVDANPDRGTLSDKIRLETSATVRDLLNERQQVHRYADVRAFTSQAPSRLEVLASDRDPGVSVAFSQEDYCDVARVLEHYYSICITDCGTGLLHSAMTGVLDLADQIVLVSSPSVDGARSASATLDWLDAHGYGDLVRNAVVALATVRPRNKSTVDLDRLEQHFAARCRAVVRVPYDPHLEEGAEVELEQLSPATTEAYLRLSATVGDGLAWPRRVLQRTATAHPGR
jgi:MinD-like ATPase involved in chromosome partitioning or flagellar assembly